MRSDIFERIFDLLISTLAVIIISPFFVLVMVCLRVTGEKKVFFKQKRVGLNGQMFGLLKFVTMLENSPNIGAGTITLKNDPRILPFGRFLRKSKFNEVPQLVNVILGDMSLIGPRPQTKACFDAFDKEAQLAINKVKPGLSGIGSIIFSNEEEMLDANKNAVEFYENTIMVYKGELEMWYASRRSFLFYLILISMTIVVVFSKKASLPFLIFKDLPKPPESLSKYIK